MRWEGHSVELTHRRAGAFVKWWAVCSCGWFSVWWGSEPAAYRAGVAHLLGIRLGRFSPGPQKGRTVPSLPGCGDRAGARSSHPASGRTGPLLPS